MRNKLGVGKIGLIYCVVNIHNLETEIRKAGLNPNKNGSTVGKAKRIRAVLNWAIENNYNAGEKLVTYLLDLLRGVGGFRCTSPNYVTGMVREFDLLPYQVSFIIRN
jgi:hypothetical protein